MKPMAFFQGQIQCQPRHMREMDIIIDPDIVLPAHPQKNLVLDHKVASNEHATTGIEVIRNDQESAVPFEFHILRKTADIRAARHQIINNSLGGFRRIDLHSPPFAVDGLIRKNRKNAVFTDCDLDILQKQMITGPKTHSPQLIEIGSVTKDHPLRRLCPVSLTEPVKDLHISDIFGALECHTTFHRKRGHSPDP